MRFLRPHVVISHCECICSGEPILVLMACGLLRIINGQNHGGEKWWLRAAQVIAAVGVQHVAIVFDLKEKIFNHTSRQIDSAVANQSANNEITVPSVHFVEAAAGDYIFIFEVEKARGIQAVGVNFSWVM